MEDSKITLSSVLGHFSNYMLKFISHNWFTLISIFLIIQILSNSNIRQVEVRIGSENGTNSFVSMKKDDSGKILIENESATLKKWNVNDFGNLSFLLDTGLAERKKVDMEIVSYKLQTCTNYINNYSELAIKQMRQYNIPASIILAQALLESNAGESKLAMESNNHFGIKCRKKCRGCTCRNYSDDDIYDMFRVFDTAFESYKEHSQLLQISRYNHLLKLDKRDYKNWAIGLKKAGYATDRNYHTKLIKIIESLKLYEYDI